MTTATQSPHTDWQALSTEELQEAVMLHNRLYWVDHAPVISDEDFDRLVEILRERAPDSPVLAAIGPAGAGMDVEALVLEGEKVSHHPPMLSLEKCYDEPTLLRWFERFEGQAIATPKMDGVAASLRYDQHGTLCLGATRGTGTLGEVITENVRHIASLPQSVTWPEAAAFPLVGPRRAVEVRGEVFMPLSVFSAKFKGAYASPRNLTAGALKLKDAARTSDYALRFYAYDLLGVEFATETEKLAALRAMGFDTVESPPLEREELQAEYERIAATRLSADFEMDGVVFKALRIDEQKRLGATAHHPRHSIAYKFQGDAGESVLREVHWSVSRTGAINPVGIVDPVQLSGAMVSRVSLHNLAIMEGLGGEGGLRLNARVLMMRRGGVIPNMERVLEPGDIPVEIPQTCPGCGAETFRENDVLMARHHANCRNARIRQLAHFTDVLDIKGFGPKILEQLYDEEIVTEPADFFTLTAAELTDLERVGPKLAEKLVEHIDERRAVPAPVFLRALGIDELSKHVSQILAQRYPSMDAIFAVTAEELAGIHTIGEVIARKVTEGLALHRALIEDLMVHMHPRFEQDAAPPAPENSPLVGKKVLFTGAMEAMPRSQAEKRVVEMGGQTPSGVTRDLNYLVLGDGDMERFRGGWRSSKLQKAEKFNADGADILIISESEFLALMGTVVL